MMLQQTVEKLFELRLRTMAKALQEQVHAGDHAGLSFEDRLGLLVDREWLARQEQKTQRRLKNAKLKQPACIENIDYRTARGLDKQVVADLATCRWIRAGRNVLLTGPTGVGKSWLACSLAEKACREGFTALYTRVPRLLEELTVARADGSYLRLLAKLERVDLLILDDWGLAPLEGQAQHDLLEVVDDRAGKRSILATSQVPTDKWHFMVGDPSVADALLDRLVGSATQINLKGASMRKGKGSGGAAD